MTFSARGGRTAKRMSLLFAMRFSVLNSSSWQGAPPFLVGCTGLGAADLLIEAFSWSVEKDDGFIW